jgi:hypothetical protein
MPRVPPQGLPPPRVNPPVQIATAPLGTSCPRFFIGDGNPVESDGRCLLVVQPDNQEGAIRLFRPAPDEFRWTVSQRSAHHFQALLAGLLKSETPGHQYLDSDDLSSPVVIVSRDEYGTDKIRSWLQL